MRRGYSSEAASVSRRTASFVSEAARTESSDPRLLQRRGTGISFFSQASAAERRSAYQQKQALSKKLGLLDDDQFQDHRALEARLARTSLEDLVESGEKALMANIKALRAVNTSPLVNMTGLTHNGQNVSPIAKDLEHIKARVAKEREEKSEKARFEEQHPARRLAEWFDAGLERLPQSTALRGRRPLPVEYEKAMWSSDEAPLIKHKETGIITWPVRIDLVPLYARSDEDQERGPLAPTLTTTVFLYTSQTGFKSIVAPPEGLDPSEVQEPHDYADEIWYRVERDLLSHEVPPVPEAPPRALVLLASEPAAFHSRKEVAQAVERSDKAVHHVDNIAHPKIGHCIAFLVPTAKCMAVPGKFSGHTVVLETPHGYADDDMSSAEHPRKTSLVTWAMRAAVMGSSKESSVEDKVLSMRLLDGLVDRSTGELLITVESMSAEDRLALEEETAKRPRRPRKEHTISAEEAEEELEPIEREALARLAKAEQAKAELERKIRIMEKATHRHQQGKQVNLLCLDPARLSKLRKMADKADVKLQLTRKEVAEVQASMMIVAEGDTSADGVEEPDAEAAGQAQARPNTAVPKRKRKKKLVKGMSEFADDVRPSAHAVTEEYAAMEGDVFRDVFGGNIRGVASWLHSKGDPNMHDEGTGWTPLIMAVSMGDPAMVELLISEDADPGIGSRELGWTPTIIAARKNSLHILSYLVKQHTSAMMDRAKDGSTPLMVAIEYAPPKIRDQMVNAMLEAHADANAANCHGWNPLSMAVKLNLRQAVKMLVQNRGSVFEEVPGTEPRLTIWQYAQRYPGLQAAIKGRLNSHDMHVIEKRWPGALGRSVAKKKEEDE